jgi:hypothetical protein
MKPEQEYRQKIDKWLSMYFFIEREVYSTDGKKIDYVLKCKESKSLFGLEVKSENHKRGNNYVIFLKQANSYNSKKWKTSFYVEPTQLPIFIAPAISRDLKQIVVESKIKHNNLDYYRLFHNTSVKHCNAHGLISGLLDIGEIKNYQNDKFCFMYHNCDIWTSYINPKHRFKEYRYTKYWPFIKLQNVL